MSKSLDRKRVSKETHEIAYCRQLALKYQNIKLYQTLKLGQIRRICKSYLKVTKGYSKRR